jgi:hypothetical protein
MNRCEMLAGLVLLALPLPAAAQGMGGLPGSPVAVPGGLSSQGARRSNDDLLAPPLDIRIEGEGLTLPKGVSPDDWPAKPPADPPKGGEAPAGGAKPPAGAAK